MCSRSLFGPTILIVFWIICITNPGIVRRRADWDSQQENKTQQGNWKRVGIKFSCNETSLPKFEDADS